MSTDSDRSDSVDEEWWLVIEVKDGDGSGGKMNVTDSDKDWDRYWVTNGDAE